MIRRYEPTDRQTGMREHPYGYYINVEDIVAKIKELEKAADDEAHAHYDDEAHGQSVAYNIILNLLEEK